MAMMVNVWYDEKTNEIRESGDWTYKQYGLLFPITIENVHHYYFPINKAKLRKGYMFTFYTKDIKKFQRKMEMEASLSDYYELPKVKEGKVPEGYMEKYNNSWNNY